MTGCPNPWCALSAKHPGKCEPYPEGEYPPSDFSSREGMLFHPDDRAALAEDWDAYKDGSFMDSFTRREEGLFRAGWVANRRRTDASEGKI